MFKSTLKKKSSINIIPMIDVIFFLLVFFMLFTSFRTNPQGIEMQLPKAVTVSEQDNQNMIIEINEEGNYFINGIQLPLNKVSEEAQEIYNDNQNIVVIINADKSTNYEYIVSLMDSLRQIGIYNLALAADKSDKNL